MNKTFEQGRAEIVVMCDYFAKNRQPFLAPGVKEADVRQSLIDPFFEALGWDVRNTGNAAPQYREVIPEPSLDVEGQQKAPDYAFRVGQTVKFYAEAKKCGVNISDEPAPAYQLRRYGWSAKVALSILTDFEELAVYDCTMRPRQADKASHARILCLGFQEYRDRWRELWDVFSREAVWSGAFDQYAAAKRKRGTSEVDKEFLREIEVWRNQLAHNIALRNRRLSSDDLNRAVQMTIDRVIFLRMAEDKALEPDQQLLTLCERPDVYHRFMDPLCTRADEKYNSGLFHFRKESGVREGPDRITPALTVDDEVFKPILQSLYFQHGCPYDFKALPVEILGTVYERFLGKVIRLTPDHHAKVEDKPEVRKAGGVYYTPAYIVDYIVKHTVGRQIEGKSPMQLGGGRGGKQPFRVLDMACGSGSFLLGAYQHLLDHALKWYSEHTPKRHRKGVYRDPHSGHWRLTIAEKKRILTTHIFGVDIDPQAVEVTKLSLLLKVLEGETDQSLHLGMLPFNGRALPNLAENIKCGNSLIGPDYFTARLIPEPEELRRINPFEWKTGFPDAMKAGGFDCVIGNPPYIRIQVMKEWAPLEVEAYKQLFRAARSGNYDIYVVFVEQGLRVLNKQGELGFILPSKFLATDYGEALRTVIAEPRALREVVDFGHAQVFDGATNYTCLLFLSRSPVQQGFYVKADSPSRLAAVPFERRPFQSTAITSAPWTFQDRSERAIAEKLARVSVPLGQLPARIARGSSTGNDDVFMLKRDGKRLVTRQGETVRVEGGILRTPIYASDFGRYRFAACSDEVVIFPYDVSPAGYRVKALAAIKRGFPCAYRYLLSRQRELHNRKQFSTWYGFSAPRNLEVHDSGHLYVPLLADKGLYSRAPEAQERFCLMASGGFSITVCQSFGLSPTYVLGILNSKLLFWRLRSISNVFRAGWVTCTKQYVETLPIRVIDPANKSDKAAHDRMVKLVDSMLAFHKQLGAAESEAQKAVTQRQIEATDREIDQLVYKLYGLTKEEIAIVEGAAK